MATSDSDDFESADEDLLDDSTKNPDHTKHSSLKLHKAPLSEKDESTDKEVVVPNKDETAAGDLPFVSKNEDASTKFVTSGTEVCSGKEVLKLNDVNEICTDNVHPFERMRRQQKKREKKIDSAPKKLGTKITSKSKPIQPASLGLGQKDDNTHLSTPSSSTEAEVDSEYFSQHEEPGLGQDINVCGSDIDPYEKFKGYSMPPNIQLCWEEGVDNNALYGISPELSHTDKENKNCVAPDLDELPQSVPIAEKVDSPTNSTWGGWGSWGVTSLLSSATEGVSTLTSHVSSVLESGIGAPNPEELARLNQLEQQKFSTEAADSTLSELVNKPTPEEPTGLFNFGQLITSMSSISKLVETTGSKVLAGGLDTLETIGKKTMEVLQEGDPGLKKKRAMFSDNTVLSQVLREAKERAELEDRDAKDRQAVIANTVHFETLFDDYQGLVHLEALEMLSKQCDLKLQSLLLSSNGPALSQLQEKLQEIKDACQLPDDEDVSEEENEPGDWWKQLATAEQTLGVPFATDKLAKIWNETQEWLKESTGTEEKIENETPSSAKEIHKKAVSTLAQLTATSVEQFHKGAEHLLVKERRNPAEEVDTLKLITSVLCSQVSAAATNYCERLNNCSEESNSDSVNSLITNIFFEASNSSSYIQEAFQLLIPVFQVGLPT